MEITNLARTTPDSITDRLDGTLIDSLFQTLQIYSESVKAVQVEGPCGDFQFYVPISDPFYNVLVDGTQEYEPVLTSELVDRFNKGSVFYNIGARYGYFSKLAQSCGVKSKHIHNFEMNKFCYHILLQNHNNDGVTCKNCKVGSTTNRKSLALDDYNFDIPTTVKIDVEGAEKFILEGMIETLSRSSPVIYIEMHPHLIPDFGYTPKDVIDIVKEIGYSDFSVVDHRSSVSKDSDLSELPDSKSYLLKCSVD